MQDRSISARSGTSARGSASLRLAVCLLCAASWSAVAPAADKQPSGQPALEGPIPAPVAPPTAEAIEQAMDRGIRFLLDDQNKDGSWGTPERTKDLNIFAPVPGAHHAFRTAVTALCVTALIEVGGNRPEVRSQRSIAARPG